MATREIARRLDVDVKTVRRHLRKIENGARAPFRTSPGSKLDPFLERIAELAGTRRTAWRIYVELRENPAFTASYELVKKHVARLRVERPRIFERLEHPAGAEVQVDFGELARVAHQGRTVRTWAFVAVWPYSRYRYVEVVLDQSVPTFLSCVQNALIAAGAVPERISVDNLAAAVLREHFHERAYQREFALLCAHYSTMPNAVRPRTPTDKGSVENGVGALKKGLRGRDFQSFDELQGAVGAWMRAMNARPNAATAKRPDDLVADERRGQLPEPYPIAAWSEHRVRTDCHVQVRSNFYSVPHEHVGKRVVVRVDANTVTVYVDFEAVARHERQIGRGRTVTDRQHYPEHKRKATQEIRRDRVDRIRSVGGGAAAFFAGLLAQREHVHSDAFRALMALVEKTNPATLDRACARAAHFGNYSLGALREIIDRKLYELPLDDFGTPTLIDRSTIVAYRPLEAYTMLIGAASC
jgi:transposase